MIRSIELNGRTINYELQIKNVKNINLRIKADQSVYVSANKKISIDTIENFMKSKSDFILNAIDRYAEREKYLPQPKKYVDGESFALLGHKRRLRVFESKKNDVEDDGVYLNLYATNTDSSELKKKTMDKWIKSYCSEVITGYCKEIYSIFEKYGIEFPQLKFRNMISRWGSCQPQRKILTFNTLLIETPVMCIEYVIMHEFTHFIYPDHSKNFYNRLSAFMPDWKERKNILEKWYKYIV
jgi:hypothetical protein